MGSRRLTVLPLLPALLALAAPAFAGWPSTPTDVDRVGAYNSSGYAPSALRAVADGAGGAYLAWSAGPPAAGFASAQLFVQHVLADGTPAWGDSGMRVRPSAGPQDLAQLVSDGAGGAIVVWRDFGADSLGDAFAQDLAATGVPRWNVNGVAVCTLGAGHLNDLVATTDGASGAFVAWTDGRNAGVSQVFAQRLDHSGAAQWATNGIAVCPGFTTSQNQPRIDADGAGGAIVGWGDDRGQATPYAQRLDGSGNTLWSAGGVRLDARSEMAWLAALAADSTGGAAFAIEDYRPNPQNLAVTTFVAQRADASGNVAWGPTGVVLAPASGSAYGLQVLRGLPGETYVVWCDFGQATDPTNVHFQRLSSDGQSAWVTPTLLTAAPQTYWYATPTPVSDGAGGLVCAWASLADVALGTWELRAQRIGRDGSPQWNPAGTQLSTSPGTVRWAGAGVSDGGHGEIVLATDYRLGNQQPEYTGIQVGATGLLANRTAGTGPGVLPRRFALSAPWPSPARGGTEVSFAVTLPAAARMRLAIQDVSGRTVRVVADAERSAGTSTLRWDGRDARGRTAPAGLYFARLEQPAASGRAEARKLVITP